MPVPKQCIKLSNNLLPFRTLLFFAGPSIVLGLTGTASGSILAGVYAKNFDISLTALGTAMLVARIFDAITDPLIGYLSDRTRTRLGPRKPWDCRRTAVHCNQHLLLFHTTRQRRRHLLHDLVHGDQR